MILLNSNDMKTLQWSLWGVNRKLIEDERTWNHKKKNRFEAPGDPSNPQEIIEHEERYVLLRMLERLEGRIDDDRDPELSQKIDCVIHLLENHGSENERSDQEPL